MNAKTKAEINSKPKVARAYVRVSFQGDRGKTAGKGFVSPELQVEKAQEYTKYRLDGYTFDEAGSRLHMDIDKSASRLKWQKRDGIVAHLEAARRGELDALIVFKLSRLARNVKEGWELFHEFEQAGCTIHCINDSIDTSTATGRLVTSILLAVAEMESENISEWVGEAALKNVKDGKIHAKQVFWITKNDDGSFSLNEKAEVMRMIVDLTLQGNSHAAVSLHLNKEGFRKPTGLLWDAEAVRRYLSPDKIHLLKGDYVYGLGKADDDNRRVILPGLVPAVISEQEAEALMAINKRNRELYNDGNQRRAAATTYILSGLLRCAHCGDKMRSHSSQPENKPARPVYTCKFATRRDIPHPLGYSITGDGLEDAVLRVVKEAVLDYRDVVENAVTAKPKPKPKDLSIDEKIEKLTQKISNLVDLYQGCHLKLEDFDRKYPPLDQEGQELRAKQEKDESETALQQMVTQTLADASNMDELTTLQARQLVKAFVESVEAPVPADHPEFSPSKKRPRKGAWVTLRFPLQDGTRRILAPIYDPRYNGERVLLDRE